MAYMQKGYLCVSNWRERIREGAGAHYPVHRLLYEEHHGVVLPVDWIVHHINGDKLDNRIENLEAVSRVEHPGRHVTNVRDGKRLCGKCDEWRPLGDFWKGQNRCKVCSVASAKAWREANPERVAKYYPNRRVKL